MKNLIIIGGGNSMRLFPGLWEDIKEHDTMVINYAYKFTKNTPKYLVSLDKKFWNNNIPQVSALELQGCKIVGRDINLKMSKNINQVNADTYFKGTQNLSGIFALDYATKNFEYDSYYLFGFDFGFINNQSHFYDNIPHSGINKKNAYYDRDGNILNAVNDFDYFKKYNIKIVGESNIKSFEKISYKVFLKSISKKEANN